MVFSDLGRETERPLPFGNQTHIPIHLERKTNPVGRVSALERRKEKVVMAYL